MVARPIPAAVADWADGRLARSDGWAPSDPRACPAASVGLVRAPPSRCTIAQAAENEVSAQRPRGAAPHRGRFVGGGRGGRRAGGPGLATGNGRGRFGQAAAAARFAVASPSVQARLRARLPHIGGLPRTAHPSVSHTNGDAHPHVRWRCPIGNQHVGATLAVVFVWLLSGRAGSPPREAVACGPLGPHAKSRGRGGAASSADTLTVMDTCPGFTVLAP